jgi:hypothetical protein
MTGDMELRAPRRRRRWGKVSADPDDRRLGIMEAANRGAKEAGVGFWKPQGRHGALRAHLRAGDEALLVPRRVRR